MKVKLTLRKLRAMEEALNARLAGHFDDTDIKRRDYEAALDWVDQKQAEVEAALDRADQL